MRGRWPIMLVLAACGGRELDPVGPAAPEPRLLLVRCVPATPAPVIADDGVSFGGLTKAETLELKRGARLPPVKGPRVVTGTPTPSNSGLDAAVIARVVRAQVPSLRGCYERELAQNPSLVARISIAFTIEADGRTSAVSVAGAPPAFGQCASRILGGLRFPAPSGGTLRVSYPFTLDQGSAPGVQPADGEPKVPPPMPWTPFALDGSRPLDITPTIARATETAVRGRLDRLAACFHGPTPTGSLRAMLDLDASGQLIGARIGGMGDRASAACIRRALDDLRVPSPSLDAAEVACDLARGDAQRWRVDPAEYDVIRATKTGIEHAGTRLVPGASEPDPLPGNRTYLVVLDPQTPGTVIELALQWAFDGDATLLATPDGTLLGVGRSTFALGEAHDPLMAQPLAFELYRDKLAACINEGSEEAGGKDVNAMLARLATQCRRQACVGTVGLAVDGDAPAAALPAVLDALRRAGFERVLVGGGSGCRRTQ